MQPAEFTIPAHYKGDTWDGIPVIRITEDGDPITGLNTAAIVMRIWRTSADSPDLTLTKAAGDIESLNATDIRIKPKVINLAPFTYRWDLRFTFTDSTVRTYLAGTWRIKFEDK